MNATYEAVREPSVDYEPLEGEIAEIDLTHQQVQDLRSQISKFFVVGYDCSQPAAVTAVSSFIENPCDTVVKNDQDIVSTEYSTYQILQYESKRELQGIRCQKILTQRVYYCGVYHHSTPFPDDSYDNRIETMSHDVCQELLISGKYTFGDGTVKHIRQGYTSRKRILHPWWIRRFMGCLRHRHHLHWRSLYCQRNRSFTNGYL